MLDHIILALQSLRSNKMRALLTMLGIIIGIGAVIAIETVGNSLTGSITDSMSGFGISDISVSLTQKEWGKSESNVPLRTFMNSAPDEKDFITDQMLDEYRAAFPENVAAIKLSHLVGSASAPAADKSADDVKITALGVNDEYMSAEQRKLLSGRGIDNQKDAGRLICVVSDVFAQSVLRCAPIDAVGQSVQIAVGGTPYTLFIAGVYEYEADNLSMTSNDDPVTDLYLPLSTARTMAGSGEGYTDFTVVTTAGTDTASFLAVTKDFFASYYTRNDTWTVETASMESLVSTVTDMLNTVSLAISAIAAISLLVGGIGVMNIMLVSITERTREIGTRKALGAPGSAIRLQFIVEAVVICLVGGGIGILAGTGLGAAACTVMGYPAKADAAVIVLAVGFSVAIGVFFGYYPASKAAKLDPIEALRYE